MQPTSAGKCVLLIPTFNEADNIASLINTFLQEQPTLQIIVADSDSPDGTADVVKEISSHNPNIELLPCARSQGRGAALAEAYIKISQRADIDTIITADADFSHDPKDVSRLLAAREHYDVVIGSRYLPDSAIIGWPWQRHAFSNAANWLARLLLPVKLHDYTNGYRAFSRRALQALDITQLDANGFIMLSQELIQWHQQNMSITEVPTTFVNRQRGASNLKLSNVAEALWTLLKLAYQTKKKTRRPSRDHATPYP